MLPTFGQVLRECLKKRGLSQLDFARRVRVSPSLISKAIRGKHVPRTERGPQWAMALDLPESDTREFIESLELANSPDGVRRLVHRLRVRIAQLEREANR